MAQAATPARSIPRWYGMRPVHNFLRKRLRLPRATAERLSHRILGLQNREEVRWRRDLARLRHGPERLGNRRRVGTYPSR